MTPYDEQMPLYVWPDKMRASDLKRQIGRDGIPTNPDQKRYQYDPHGTLRETIKCSVCTYKEEIEQGNCIHCNGTGRVVKSW